MNTEELTDTLELTIDQPLRPTFNIQVPGWVAEKVSSRKDAEGPRGYMRVILHASNTTCEIHGVSCHYVRAFTKDGISYMWVKEGGHRFTDEQGRTHCPVIGLPAARTLYPHAYEVRYYYWHGKQYYGWEEEEGEEWGNRFWLDEKASIIQRVWKNYRCRKTLAKAFEQMNQVKKAKARAHSLIKAIPEGIDYELAMEHFELAKRVRSQTK